MSKTFMYFAYGSNLLTKRLHVQNPSAVKRGCGKLKDFQLDFNYYSKRWKGAAATIVPKEGAYVWGAIYEIDNEHIPSLDNQEGVHDNVYFPLEVDVETPEGAFTKCRVYQQCNNPPVCDNLANLPDDRKPSAVYLNLIRRGAVESNLPEDYVKFLHNIADNGYDGEVDVKMNIT
ncbi:gamma-glutamylcyclotransferase-like [Atheta coriaria]|uniref:gamma-glutamylcyclotransferase-like n=1 Tax=Dalotia coriaria TaxID=877792 RepID=UPI0031F36AB3